MGLEKGRENIKVDFEAETRARNVRESITSSFNIVPVVADRSWAQNAHPRPLICTNCRQRFFRHDKERISQFFVIFFCQFQISSELIFEYTLIFLNDCVALYFITFHLIAVMILLQIVIAIYVEAFIAFQEKEEEIVAHEEEVRLISDDESGEEGRGSITNMTLNQDEVNAVTAMRRMQFLKRSQMARSSRTGGGSSSTAGGGRGGQVVRRRMGSMPGFVSPLNAVARMDMPAFEESEIAVLTNLGSATIGSAAQKANEEEQEELKSTGRSK